MIELRDLRDEDEDLLFQWRSEPEVDRWMSDAAFPSREAHAGWFSGLRSDPDMQGWLITRGGVPAGLLTFTGLLSHHRRAGWNWFLGSAEARGRGVGRAAQVLGLDRAFVELGLHKVFAEVMADNDAALKAQAASGFRREGYLRGHVLKNGAPRDVVLLGILADEWHELREAARRSLVEAHLIAG
ncbi:MULTISPECIES: GNAT family N-acetyltransferase [unclassified Caulobacter]|uniref:GNAT family N-acetyltransferase n=1 Tax=unclassified Caulobacter TaxID=2648921 RepID=UPI000D368821|nr:MULTISPECIES: GNAT family N-acetyltransferase [unclassified Caulobacter]PTS90406.1 UDP-4-amino-4,6-dideoxy-N-acetyl-beta-L-altrosamine N-acetyltransferase [Caulobacter sp. HMWF009]PTT08704.1 UDP-4-amino-4,6-dideoxy-N-acetyl-beta-L-altrosamine N-acetyltransferase [Caulobacter sp. HMWF025]PTT80096.1 UDP-4-amino-4,6-dideoxy-N-acetyl-beta-L-altrosamine N-acetyltransferase [Pseudomonas sp. HMWF010]